MVIEFSDNLITGNKTLDAQHKELIGRIAALVKVCEEGACGENAVKMLDYLMDYTRFHFAEEERLQIKVSYPNYAEHKARHEEFKKTVETLHKSLEESKEPTEELTEQVKKLIVDWLIQHVQEADRSLAAYINDPNRL